MKPAGGASQTVRVSQSTAEFLGLIEPTLDGGPDCSQEALELAIGMDVTILATNILLDEGPKHPVGDALATFFGEDITFEDMTIYDAVMKAHEEDGFGFGVIAQALWLTRNLWRTGMLSDLEAFDTPEKLFGAILLAKDTDIYTAFFPEDTENIPTSWGQFKKALLDKKNNLGVVMSDQAQDNSNNGNNGINNGNVQGQGNNNSHKNEDKNNEKGNNGKNEDKGDGKNK